MKKLIYFLLTWMLGGFLGYTVGVVDVLKGCAVTGKYKVDNVYLMCVVKDEGDMNVWRLTK